MDIYHKFSCIYCGQHIEVDSACVGRQFHCPSCKGKLVVPSPVHPRADERLKPIDQTWGPSVPDPKVLPSMTQIIRNPNRPKGDSKG